MNERLVVMIVALLVLNLCTLWLMRGMISAVDLKSSLTEKATGADAAVHSSSRVVGFLGAVVMVGFLWGVGNYLVYAAFFEMDKIPIFLTSILNFFLSGATMFLPYLANKVTNTLKTQEH